MKTSLANKTLLTTAALFLFILTCHGQQGTSALLAGKWTKTINGNTITFTLTSDFKYQVDFVEDEVAEVWGSYTVSGDRFTVNDEGGDYSADVPGEYTFQVDDTSLNFTEVEDPVEGRKSMMVGTWTKEKVND